jgi:hypothetical protein
LGFEGYYEALQIYLAKYRTGQSPISIVLKIVLCLTSNTSCLSFLVFSYIYSCK